MWNTLILDPMVNSLLWIYDLLANNFGLAIIAFTIIRLAAVGQCRAHEVATRDAQFLRDFAQQLEALGVGHGAPAVRVGGRSFDRPRHVCIGRLAVPSHHCAGPRRIQAVAHGTTFEQLLATIKGGYSILEAKKARLAELQRLYDLNATQAGRMTQAEYDEFDALSKLIPKLEKEREARKKAAEELEYARVQTIKATEVSAAHAYEMDELAKKVEAEKAL